MSKGKAKVAPGPALDTPDEALDMLALVTPEDIEAAKADGRARMRRVGREMQETPRTPTGDEDVPLGA